MKIYMGLHKQMNEQTNEQKNNEKTNEWMDEPTNFMNVWEPSTYRGCLMYMN